jgi:catechol 2,3-dioxygenase-like lactoylglutathione lyase family enzyme
MPRMNPIPALSTTLGALLCLSAASAPPVNPLKLTPHHITASVADLDRAAAWYQDILGFEIRERGRHGPVKFVELAIPGFGVALVQETAPAGHSTKPQTDAPRWIHIVFAVPDPDAAFRILKDKGASLSTRGPVNGRIESFLVTDSEGNEIEILGAPAP